MTRDASRPQGDEWVHETDTSESLGDGFIDHGSVGFRTYSRGWVSTHDGDTDVNGDDDSDADAPGNDVVLVWVTDVNTGLLGVIDVDAGTYEEYTPDDRSMGHPYTSLLSSRNRFYACNRQFVEFDPARREFTFVSEAVDYGDALAMSMTEDDEGVIWAANYPDATVVSYDPGTGEFRHYGRIYDHPSSMYPRSIAADDEGWIYVGIRPAAGQIVALDRDSGETTPLLADDETVSDGDLSLTRDESGVVYGQAGDRWLELHGGSATELDGEPEIDEVEIVTGTQSLSHRELPSGRRVVELDLGRPEPYLAVEDPETGARTTVSFEPSGGEVIPMGLTAGPDGTIVGGSYLPVQFFRYLPDTDEWFKTNNVGQWNVAVGTDECVYAGHYPAGALLRWDPAEPWDPPEGEDEADGFAPAPECNPALLAEDWDHLHRPFTILVHPDGRHVIMGGQPDYGRTGGGLMFWDREAETAEVLTHEEVLEWHITQSLVALPDGDLFAGTDTRPAGGGVKKADVAKLYRMDFEEREVVWSVAPFEGVTRYPDLAVLPDGNVLGVADRERLFVFDPEGREVVHETELGEQPVDHQGPCVFVVGADDRLFVLFESGTIAEFDLESYELLPRAECPTGIRNGGAVRDGRLYFATETNVYSWTIPPAE